MPGQTFYGRRALRLRRYIFRGCENWDPFRPARLHRDYSFHGRETWAAAASRLWLSQADRVRNGCPAPVVGARHATES